MKKVFEYPFSGSSKAKLACRVPLPRWKEKRSSKSPESSPLHSEFLSKNHGLPLDRGAEGARLVDAIDGTGGKFDAKVVVQAAQESHAAGHVVAPDKVNRVGKAHPVGRFFRIKLPGKGLADAGHHLKPSGRGEGLQRVRFLRLQGFAVHAQMHRHGQGDGLLKISHVVDGLVIGASLNLCTLLDRVVDIEDHALHGSEIFRRHVYIGRQCIRRLDAAQKGSYLAVFGAAAVVGCRKGDLRSGRTDGARDRIAGYIGRIP